MVQCICGKPVEKIPAWLEGVKVSFVCNNCPNRQVKNIAFMAAEFEPKAPPKLEDDLDLDMPDEEAAEE
jgi:hypothetical protein